MCFVVRQLREITLVEILVVFAIVAILLAPSPPMLP